jgi:hypothetical protein
MHKKLTPPFSKITAQFIAHMNNLLKLWAALIKDPSSKYAEAHGILSEQQDGFLLLRIIHDALASIIMIMEVAKICKKDICIMHADFKGAFNAADQRIMPKHMLQVGMPSTFTNTCERPYGVSTINYNTP